MTRRQMRELVFHQLFLAEFYPIPDKAEQCRIYLEELGIPEEEQRFGESLPEDDRALLLARCDDVRAHIEELDAKINEASDGWKTSRMGRVDLAILRLALYEILFDEEVPVKVGINEAVELAKLYGGDDSPSFVNAILGKLAKTL